MRINQGILRVNQGKFVVSQGILRVNQGKFVVSQGKLRWIESNEGILFWIKVYWVKSMWIEVNQVKLR